ncbi:MAG: D-tyrosyl-tRNA(Tyr) deacylase [Clostridia bacterium]|nr:D-tyrosyl-tRNA(Tyr) deacylase [Clostridia bacterium]
MRAVIQRVSRASVTADGVPTGSIGRGLLVLLGVGLEDDEKDAENLAVKISKLRIFEDENEKMNLSVNDVGGGVLVVSNFTLLADYHHGNRPNFLLSAPPDKAVPLYEKFISFISREVPDVKCGVFGADMQVDLLNDGPVTIVMDSEVLRR